MTQQLELGLGTFGDVTRGSDGHAVPYPQVIRNVVAEAVLADSLGVDVFGIGEHHRSDFAISSPETVLAAIAGQTSRIRLGSAVTVLSSDDPVRVFQRFATLDAVSNGRAEVILGRGSFTESFPLFGFSLGNYERLFEEKLDLFATIRKEEAVTWSGTVREPLIDQHIYPTTESGALPTWVGVGGSPESVVRAARHGLPLMLAVIGGAPERFAAYVELFRSQLAVRGAAELPVGIHSPGHIAETDDAAAEEAWPFHQMMHDRIGRGRGWGPIARQQYDREIESGSLYVGSPETVAQKIATTVRALGLQRFDLKYSTGLLPHEAMMRSIELYGSRVIPRVRELLAADAE